MREELIEILEDYYSMKGSFNEEDIKYLANHEKFLDIDEDDIRQASGEMEEVTLKGKPLFRKQTKSEKFMWKIYKVRNTNIKELGVKGVLIGIYNFIVSKGKKITPYIIGFLKFLFEKGKELWDYISKKEVNISKQTLQYKRIVQNEVDEARRGWDRGDELKRADYEKTFLKLTEGKGIIPPISVPSRFKFSLISMRYDLKILIAFIIYTLIVIKVGNRNYHWEMEIRVLSIMFYELVFLLGNSFLVISRIKKVVEEDLENFMWEDFMYGNGLEIAYYNLMNPSRGVGEGREEIVLNDTMDIVEVDNGGVVGQPSEGVRNLGGNQYEKALKEWNEKYFKQGEIIPFPIEEKDRNEYITRFSFNVPLDLELDMVERRIPDYSRHCGKTILHDEKSIKDSKITLFIEEKELPTRIKFDESKIDKSSDTRVYVGEAFDGSVYLDFDDNPHMLIGGSSRCGKGVTQNVILTQLTQKGEVIIMDLSTKAGADYSYYRDKGYRIVTQLEETLEFFKGLQEEARIRMRIFREHGKNKLSAYNNAVSEEEKIYRKFIIIDEYASLKRVDKEDEDEAKEIEKTIIALGEQAGAVGIHIIIATQNAKATIINTELRNNLLLRAVGRCADFNASNVFLENDFASVKKEVPLIKSHETGRFIVSGAITKDRLAINEHFVVQVPYMEFAGDNAEEHIRKYGHLVETPKTSKAIERYKRDSEEIIELKDILNKEEREEEKTNMDYI